MEILIFILKLLQYITIIFLKIGALINGNMNFETRISRSKNLIGAVSVSGNFSR